MTTYLTRFQAKFLGWFNLFAGLVALGGGISLLVVLENSSLIVLAACLAFLYAAVSFFQGFYYLRCF